MQLEEFSGVWSLLEQRFDTEKETRVVRFYYDELTARLTDDEIREAVRRAAYANTYFPSPKELVDAVKPSSTERALTEWGRVKAWVEEKDGEAIRKLNDEARRIADSMGVLDLGGFASAKDMAFIRRRFMDEYAEIADHDEPPALEPSEQQERIPAPAS